MTQYVDKSALVAEINKRITDAPINHIGHQRVWAYNDVKDIIDSLEVKEMDLDEEFDNYCDNLYLIDFENEPYAALFECAKYFLNLDLKHRKENKL
jgi:hypothetical protein